MKNILLRLFFTQSPSGQVERVYYDDREDESIIQLKADIITLLSHVKQVSGAYL